MKEGTDTSQGKPQIISNVNACEAVVDAVRSTLGPRGMDKLIVDGHGNDNTTSMLYYSFFSCVILSLLLPRSEYQ